MFMYHFPRHLPKSCSCRAVHALSIEDVPALLQLRTE